MLVARAFSSVPAAAEISDSWRNPAAVLHGIDDIRFEDVPLPDKVADGHVRVQMRAVGICGSDVQYYKKASHTGSYQSYRTDDLQSECHNGFSSQLSDEQLNNFVLPTAPGRLAYHAPVNPVRHYACIHVFYHHMSTLVWGQSRGTAKILLTAFLFGASGTCWPLCRQSSYGAWA